MRRLVHREQDGESAAAHWRAAARRGDWRGSAAGRARNAAERFEHKAGVDGVEARERLVHEELALPTARREHEQLDGY